MGEVRIDMVKDLPGGSHNGVALAWKLIHAGAPMRVREHKGVVIEPEDFEMYGKIEWTDGDGGGRDIRTYRWEDRG